MANNWLIQIPPVDHQEPIDGVVTFPAVWMICVQRATLAITRVRRVAGPSCVVTIAAERVIWCDDARWREVFKSPSKLRGDCSSGDCLVDSEWLRGLLRASVGVRTDAES